MLLFTALVGMNAPQNGIGRAESMQNYPKTHFRQTPDQFLIDH
jgi:hypothetical protein